MKLSNVNIALLATAALYGRANAFSTINNSNAPSRRSFSALSMRQPIMAGNWKVRGEKTRNDRSTHYDVVGVVLVD